MGTYTLHKNTANSHIKGKFFSSDLCSPLTKRYASAGNRIRAALVAGEHSTTEPPMQVNIARGADFFCSSIFTCGSYNDKKTIQYRRKRSAHMYSVGVKRSEWFRWGYIAQARVKAADILAPFFFLVGGGGQECDMKTTLSCYEFVPLYKRKNRNFYV